MLVLASSHRFVLVVSSGSSGFPLAGSYLQQGDRLQLKMDPIFAGARDLEYQYGYVAGDGSGQKPDQLKLTDPNRAESRSGDVGQTVLNRAGDALVADRVLASTKEIARLGDAPIARVHDAPIETVENTTCASNLRQLGLAAMMYSQDYDLTLPDAKAWNDQLRPYTKNDLLLTCPSVKRQGGKFGYAYNRNMSSVQTSAIPSPRSEFLIFESSSLQANASDPVSSLLHSPRHVSILLTHADGSLGKIP